MGIKDDDIKTYSGDSEGKNEDYNESQSLSEASGFPEEEFLPSGDGHAVLGNDGGADGSVTPPVVGGFGDAGAQGQPGVTDGGADGAADGSAVGGTFDGGTDSGPGPGPGDSGTGIGSPEAQDGGTDSRL